MEHVVIFVGMYTQLQTVLYYSYTYDMIFVTTFLKLNVNYIQPQYQLSCSEIFWVDSWYIAIHRHIFYRQVYATSTMV